MRSGQNYAIEIRGLEHERRALRRTVHLCAVFRGRDHGRRASRAVEVMDTGAALALGHKVLVDTYRVKLVTAGQRALQVAVLDQLEAAKATAQCAWAPWVLREDRSPGVPRRKLRGRMCGDWAQGVNVDMAAQDGGPCGNCSRTMLRHVRL
jgi:hypothetical protein